MKLSSFEEVYGAYRVFIMDLDGTLNNQNAEIPGVVDCVFRLMTDPTKKVLFFTNGGYANLDHTFGKVVSFFRDGLSAEKWAAIEGQVTKNIVYNTAQLTAKYFKSRLEPNSKVMVFGNEGLLDECLNEGLRAELLEPLLPEETEYSPILSDVDFGRMVLDPEVRALAKGVCFNFDQRKLAVASMYLQSEAVTEFVVTNDDPVFVSGASGRLMPDVGATLAALETASGRTAHSVGKPGSYCLQAILEDHFQAERAEWKSPEFLSQFCYVGDNLQQDVYFAKNSGIGSVLVLSGITKESDAEAIEQAAPSFIMRKFAD